MEYLFSFEKLRVWQDARILVVKIYQLTDSLPAIEKFGLVSQLRRSAVSVCANIAEGVSRNSAKEQAHFTSMAYGSLMEILSHLQLMNDLHFITIDKLYELRKIIQPLSLKINNLRNRQMRNATLRS